MTLFLGSFIYLTPIQRNNHRTVLILDESKKEYMSPCLTPPGCHHDD